jgi:hypothetical protein
MSFWTATLLVTTLFLLLLAGAFVILEIFAEKLRDDYIKRNYKDE